MGWSAFRPAGLTHHNVALSSKGYTLFSPQRGTTTFLLDMQGLIVHQWYHDNLRGPYGRLLDNGNLLVLANYANEDPLPPGKAGDPQLPLERRLRGLGGNATVIREIDWEGEIVWEYANPAIHHDFVRLPNGNTLLPMWVEMEPELQRSVRGGERGGRHNKPPMLGDVIIEVSPGGKIVRQLDVHLLLDPVRDSICPLERRLEWTHMNGIDVDDDGRIVFSCRNTSTVGVIDTEGNLAWKYGAPNVHHQHHPTWLPNGNIQLFDNGMHRPGLSRSSVLEVDPKSDEVAWRYLADPEQQFFSTHISSAQRLGNGNVLICEGVSGRLFEVTRRGDIAWEWLNPISTATDGISQQIFRAHRYGPEHPALAGKDLMPDKALNRLHGLMLS